MKEKFVRSHQRLEAWKVAMDLVTELYREMQRFPKNEQYGLCSQIKRAAVSVPANIAEGAARESPRDYLRFLHYSLGSLSELETELTIAKRLNYIEADSPVFELLDRSSWLLNGLIKYIKSLTK
ncbi:MAG: four helix bundle protein [Bacteroidota bacterium]